jgi:hypothetical protein
MMLEPKSAWSARRPPKGAADFLSNKPNARAINGLAGATPAPGIRKRPQFLPWTAPKDQFGERFRRMNNFKAQFRETIRAVACVYPEARFELDDRGMLLAHSPPPVPCRLLALKR